MSTKQIAEQLNGIEYPARMSEELMASAKAQGIVIVYGMSDDLMEFRGAIYDEIGAYDGGLAYVTKRGLVTNDCENDECPHFMRQQEAAHQIAALWCPGDQYSWRIEAGFPHETFEIVEDGEPYCRGIVFALSDLGSPA